MENNYLDKVVKGKLQHLEVEYQAATWDMLEQKMAVAEEATKLEDTALDGMVYAALQDYEVPFEENDWAAMSQRLDDNLVDATVLGALGRMEVPYQESDWAAMSQRLDDNLVDATVLGALGRMEVPYQESDWAEMSQRLDDNLIDTTVLGALGSMEVPYQESNWAEMSQRLDDNLIDTTVLGALGRMEVPYQESNWAAMSERLDNAVLDDTVFEALNDLNAVYNDKHWVLMSERLDAIFVRPFQIIRYKLAELVFLFLLIFGVGEYISTQRPTVDIPVAKIETEKTNLTTSKEVSPEEFVTKKEENKKEADLSNPSEKELKETKTNVSNTNPPIVEKSAKKDKIRNKSTTPKNGVWTTNSTGVPAVKVASPAEKPSTKIAEKESIVTLKTTPSTVKDNSLSSIADDNVADTNTEEVTFVVENLERKAYLILTPINLLNRDIPFLNTPKDKDLSSVSLLKIPVKKKAEIRVGMFGVANSDYIRTPYDPVLGLSAYSRYAPGYGGGISIGWKYNRWELETAIAYMAKRYNNRPFVHIYGGSVIEGLQANFLTAIELNIVNIPLHINYHIINSGKWHLYGLTGGTMQVVLQASYDANRAELDGVEGASFSGGSKVSEDNNKSLFSRKDFNDGFLADKNFKENSYYTLDVGMGLERYLSPYWNVFIQPVYQYNLPELTKNKGLGPNNDKINTFQLLIGIKSNLK